LPAVQFDHVLHEVEFVALLYVPEAHAAQV
jgi:hypothetical protein